LLAPAAAPFLRKRLDTNRTNQKLSETINLYSDDCVRQFRSPNLA
jgi:hypothetical protein